MVDVANRLRELADEIDEQSGNEETDLPVFGGYQMQKDLTPENMLGGVYLDSDGHLWAADGADYHMCIGDHTEEFVKNIREEFND